MYYCASEVIALSWKSGQSCLRITDCGPWTSVERSLSRTFAPFDEEL